MNGLCVKYGDTLHYGEWHGEAWNVSYVHDGEARSLVYGFARQRDAEIGMAAMLSLAVDWTDDRAAVRQQLDALGLFTHEDFLRVACEHLNW